MTCDDIHRYTDVYLDGEFSPDDKQEFEAHVSRCANCATHLQQQRMFRESVRSVLTAQAAPPHLRAKIEAALAAENQPTMATHVRRWAPALAVAAVLAFVLAQPTTDADPSNDTTVTVTAKSNSRRSSMTGIQPVGHTRELRSLHRMAPDVTGDATTIRQYVDKRLESAVALPLRKTKGLTLSGAREITFQGYPAVMYIYSTQDGRIGVIHAPHLATEAGDFAELSLERHGSLTVGTFQSGNQRFAVVSDLDVATLKPYLR